MGFHCYMLPAIQVLAVPVPSCTPLGWILPISLWVCSLLGTHKAFALDLVLAGPYLHLLSPAGSGLFYLPCRTVEGSLACSLAPQHRRSSGFLNGPWR